MSKFGIGMAVARLSYNCDLLFRIIELKKDETGRDIAVLYGEDFRLIADAPFTDLKMIDDTERNRFVDSEREKQEHSFSLFKQDYHLIKERNEYQSTNGYSVDQAFFQMPGRVLHLDGDPNYLKKCLALYEKIGVPVYGVHCKEIEMPERIGPLIEQIRPDILVITGHDAYSKSKGKVSELKAYRHSKQFVQTVIEARRKVPHLDQLVIFAGACQSHFESLIRAGANFASSPSRVNIHALDPVYIVAKISFTPFMDRINVWDVVRNTLTGEKGLGGIETKGVLRTGMPFNRFEE
ncbi:sporulation peptidase YabG [Bacillus suaedaesalsae]|uniref:Sporulation peptidase YabG n=1 Tax=Bacillus suaedaesalsae TaxID=2810349 RepID=A0ABS2DCL4_9BACI|nr:sporulation peptidase YabG [Bacillus suaedaesalsae]MBM6616208.1 sporulation peptidase YabG [Bacillus suaedaesalsae]